MSSDVNDRQKKKSGADRRYAVVGGLCGLLLGFLLSLVLGLVFLGGLRQRFYERRIGVKLRAGASSSTFLAVLATSPLDALQLGNT
jgi:ABC-type antimicrobial peptide transport system permease subunit